MKGLNFVVAGTLAAIVGSVSAQWLAGDVRTEYLIAIQDKPASRFLANGLLGTHSLWWGHQASLMVSGTGKTHPKVIEWLAKTGGVVRYGGGINEIPWQACAGPRKARLPYKVVPWSGPMTCQFGIDEYLDMTRQAGSSTAWAVANIAGVDHKIWPLAQMESENGFAAKSLHASASDLQRVWELGNELDRGRYLWSPELRAERSAAAARVIRQIDPDTKLILPLMDYDHPQQPTRTVYNERLLRQMSAPIDGVSHHIYYDGLHGGPSIPTQMKPVIESAALYRKLKGKPAEVWVTEHGRWPDGQTSDPAWRSRWYQTNDLSGVLGTADFLIALSQEEDVAGAMLHGLRAGPWNTFDLLEGEPRPTGVGRLLSLFARSGPGVRLKTVSSGPNRSGYRGGYDLRAAAFKTAAPGELVMWVINRAAEPSKVAISVPPSLQAGFADGVSLVCSQPAGRCNGEQFREISIRAAQFESTVGGLVVSLPASSVSTFRLLRP